MATKGERFEMPDGSVYVVRQPAAETGGEVVEMEFILPSGCVPPPPHVHPSQMEGYEVLEGSFEVVIDGRCRTLTAGESASVPVGALHTFRNRSGDVVRVRNWHRPALRFEQFIERTCEVLRAAEVKRKRDPRVLLYLSMVMLEFEETLTATRRRDRVPMQALAWLARRIYEPRQAEQQIRRHRAVAIAEQVLQRSPCHQGCPGGEEEQTDGYDYTH